jgi:3-hydroxyacyl-CoA dehydrogenase
MSRFETPRVAIIGAGEIGRGWAALAIGAGWPVAIFDPDSGVLAGAEEEIAERVDNLAQLRRAEVSVAQDALNQMRVARSLLQAVTDADWIIEAASEDLHLKQKLLEQIEQVCRRAAVISSSTRSFTLAQICARVAHPDRVMVAHPLTPVELMPAVEVVPGPQTDPTCVEDVRFWLSMLGRAPIVLQKEIPGHLVGRISAAVWRECIHLVLEGVLDVEDVDRAVSIGPALIWAASGPHLEHVLNAGEEGADMYFSRLLAESEEQWKSLATFDHLSAEDRLRLMRLIGNAYAAHLNELNEARNQRLIRLLVALRE